MTSSNRDVFSSKKRSLVIAIPGWGSWSTSLGLRRFLSFCSTILSMKLLFSCLPHCDLMVTRWLLYLQPQVHIQGKKGAARRKRCYFHQEIHAFSEASSTLLLTSQCLELATLRCKEGWEMQFFSLACRLLEENQILVYLVWSQLTWIL